jgi:hypothetical protein
MLSHMRRQASRERGTVLALAVVALVASSRPANAAADHPPQQEPVQCWWRTSIAAVRVAQPFSLRLTCSIVESNQQHVVVDQAKLGAGAIPVSPFEVIGGGSLTESRSNGRWFFQRVYQLRIITDAFGVDVQVPQVVISYQLETESPAGGRARGVERRHVLPPLPMRVLSLVPAVADDIREAEVDTFEEIDDAIFAASLYRTAGLLFIGIGVIGLAAAVATGFRVRHPRAAGGGTLDARLILRHVGRELEGIRAARTRAGWTPDLIGRALAATRVVASCVTRRPLSLRSVESHEQVPAGVLMHTDTHGRRTLIGSSLTAPALRGAAVDNTVHRSAIQDALAALTRAHYGRDEPLEDGGLDAGIDAALAAVADVGRDHSWTTRARAAAAQFPRLRSPWSR